MLPLHNSVVVRHLCPAIIPPAVPTVGVPGMQPRDTTVRRRPVWSGGFAFVLVAATAIPWSTLGAQEKVDAATIEKIRSEETNHSQVMELMSWLSDVYGPRLTWSPNATRAERMGDGPDEVVGTRQRARGEVGHARRPRMGERAVFDDGHRANAVHRRGGAAGVVGEHQGSGRRSGADGAGRLSR